MRLDSLRERGGLWVAAQGPLMLAAVALPPWLDQLANGAWRWIAGAMLLCGMMLGIWSRSSLGASFTPLPMPVEGGEQVTRGPYRFVRHPMYLAIIVSAAGWAELWQSIAGAFATVALFVFFDLKAAREERWLEVAYPGYAEYRRRIRKLIPFVY